MTEIVLLVALADFAVVDTEYFSAAPSDMLK